MRILQSLVSLVLGLGDHIEIAKMDWRRSTKLRDTSQAAYEAAGSRWTSEPTISSDSGVYCTEKDFTVASLGREGNGAAHTDQRSLNA